MSADTEAANARCIRELKRMLTEAEREREAAEARIAELERELSDWKAYHYGDTKHFRRKAAALAKAQQDVEAEIERLTRERDNYQARVIPAETGIVRAEAQMMDVVERTGDDIVTLRAELAKAREALGRISSNGFGHPLRNLDPKRDKEILAMMDYARSTLAALTPEGKPECPICEDDFRKGEVT